MEYKAKTIHFQLPIIALPFLFSDRISTLLATCVRQPGVSLYGVARLTALTV
ncbi:hypothetical protein [Pleurocapsa sp. FMAR1]|uniref:hypothetical protein n=1 Tax=Pleurocapsa sp. FMAR1 TaxID=3040204 RepID=UPI0029C739D4|nr:hypothetical protein [Pleurocapsa sp. FMAR1]